MRKRSLFGLSGAAERVRAGYVVDIREELLRILPGKIFEQGDEVVDGNEGKTGRVQIAVFKTLNGLPVDHGAD